MHNADLQNIPLALAEYSRKITDLGLFAGGQFGASLISRFRGSFCRDPKRAFVTGLLAAAGVRVLYLLSNLIVGLPARPSCGLRGLAGRLVNGGKRTFRSPTRARMPEPHHLLPLHPREAARELALAPILLHCAHYRI